MPQKIFKISGISEEIEQVFAENSKKISIKNRGLSPVSIFFYSGEYEEEPFLIRPSQELKLNLMTDRLKFLFDRKSQIELLYTF